MSWSISSHNNLTRRSFGVPAPVAVVNAWTWRDLSSQRIGRFQRRYGRFLSSFDGFVVTHAAALTQLYFGLDRPILTVLSTRYEDPYTGNRKSWAQLDRAIERSLSTGQMTVCANNRGDADYFRYFTGIEVPVVPSLCERQGGEWRRDGTGIGYAMTRGIDLSVGEWNQLRGRFTPLPTGYSWSTLCNAREVFVVPQNISTVTLFELATAGVPVAVPSRKWLATIALSNANTLRELTFAQLHRLQVPDTHRGSPLDWKSSHYLDWWLDRADFYDEDLMPNVRVVDSVSELMEGQTTADGLGREYWPTIQSRNGRLAQLRDEHMRSFLGLVHNAHKGTSEAN